MPQSGGVWRKRVAGALLMALGAFALAAPVAAGRWSLAILGIPLIVLSVAEAYAAFTSPRRADPSAYLPCLLALLAGNPKRHAFRRSSMGSSISHARRFFGISVASSAQSRRSASSSAPISQQPGGG